MEVVLPVVLDGLGIPDGEEALQVDEDFFRDVERDGDDVGVIVEFQVAELGSNDGGRNLLTHSRRDDWPVHREVLGKHRVNQSKRKSEAILLRQEGGISPNPDDTGEWVYIIYHSCLYKKIFQKKKFQKNFMP